MSQLFGIIIALVIFAIIYIKYEILDKEK